LHHCPGFSRRNLTAHNKPAVLRFRASIVEFQRFTKGLNADAPLDVVRREHQMLTGSQRTRFSQAIDFFRAAGIAREDAGALFHHERLMKISGWQKFEVKTGLAFQCCGERLGGTDSNAYTDRKSVV